MFKMDRFKATVAMLATLSSVLGMTGPVAAASAAEDVIIDPGLAALFQDKNAGIPERLRGELGGFQGRRQLAGEDALSLIVKTEGTREELEKAGFEVGSFIAGIATVTVRPADLGTLAELPGIRAIALPSVARASLDVAMPHSGVDHLRSRSGVGFTGHTGSGVIVGVLDSGIDLSHLNFEDGAGNTRILYLWDLSENDPTRHPTGFSRGTEWTATDIDAGLPTQEDRNGHGTHVAGAAAGNGDALDENGGQAHIGVAPGASLIIVKSSAGDQGAFPEDDQLDGLAYIFDKAASLGMPAVVNMSFGGHGGIHEGVSPVEIAIDEHLEGTTGRAVVVAAGNEGDADIVNGDQVVAGTKLRLKIEPTGIVSSTALDAFVLTGYYDESQSYEIKIQHRFSVNVPFTTLATRTLGTPTFPGSTCTVATPREAVQVCNSTSSLLMQDTDLNEYQVIVVEREDPATGIVHEPFGHYRLVVDGGPATTDSRDHVVWLSNISSAGWYFEEGTAAKTVGMPATSREAISVGAYNTKPCWTAQAGTAHQSALGPYGRRADFSSRGPTNDGRVKPDLVAPGSWLVSARSGDWTPLPQEAPLLINDDYFIIPGTSMAAPVVTGAVALLFEEDPSYTHTEVKKILQANARQDDFSDIYAPLFFVARTSRPLGPDAFRQGASTYFGHGKLDLSRHFLSDAYETNDTLLQARKIVSGDSVSAGMVGAADVDLFTLPDLEPDDTVRILMTGADPTLELDVQTATFFSNCTGYTTVTSASAFNLPFTFSEGMFVNMAPTDGIRVHNGKSGYVLDAVIIRPEEEPNGNAGSAQLLPNFKEIEVSGTINGWWVDQDFFEFVAYPGEVIAVTREVGSNKFVSLLDSNNNVLVPDSPELTFALPWSFPPRSSLLRLRVVGATSGQYRYKLEVDP